MARVVLLSGGIDSLVCAEIERREGRLAGCVFVDYAHPAQVREAWKAFSFCGQWGVPLKVVHAFGLDLGDMASEVGARVVPHRNAVLLTLAANAAASMGATGLVIGCNAADQRDYPDCRPGFLDAVEQVVGMAIHAPLLDKTKGEVVALARAIGLSEADAWSCYLGGAKPCGKCPSCAEAATAWGTDGGAIWRSECCGKTGRELEVNGHAPTCRP